MRHLIRGAGVALCAATLVFLFGCGNEPVAVVNGTKITRDAFYNRLKKTAGKDVLAGMIQRQLIEDAFAKSGLKVTDKEIQDKIDGLEKRFPTPDAFDQALKQQGLTMADLKKEMALQIKVEKLCTKDVKFTDADLKKFFDQYKSSFAKPERVVLSQIQTSSKADADKIYAELQKPSANFAALARQYSVDPMFRDAGGRMPETPIDRIPAGIQKIIHGLKPGQVAPPVKMQKNWFIFKLEETKPPEPADFQKQHADVEEQYKARQAISPQDLIAQVSKNAQVQIVDPDLADVQKMFMPAEKLPTFGNEKSSTSGAKAPAAGAKAPAPGAKAPEASPAPAAPAPSAAPSQTPPAKAPAPATPPPAGK